MKKYGQLSQKQQKIILIFFILLFAANMILVSYYVGNPLIQYAKQPELFKQWIDSRGIWGKLIYVLIVTLQVIVAIIPGEPFEIAGGYCFDLLEGTLLCLAGIVLGSAIIFAFVRRFGHYFIEIFVKKEQLDKLAFLKDPSKLNFLTFLIFAIPGTPKDLLTYAVGLTEMDIKTWILIAFFARIPSVITSTYAGYTLGEKNYVMTALIFVVTMVISIIGIIIYNRHSAKKAVK
ncbi:MAG: TVP38/TMEM64 family protein [Erysipelotrichaceae bacterium]|nr:TVP38/TMEM64 family protein [Erysipelotrichaceae bacterium]